MLREPLLRAAGGAMRRDAKEAHFFQARPKTCEEHDFHFAMPGLPDHMADRLLHIVADHPNRAAAYARS